MQNERERVIELSTTVAALRLRVQQAETDLEVLRAQLHEAERALDQLLAGDALLSSSRPIAERVRDHFATHPENAFSPADVTQALGLGAADHDALRQALHHLTQKRELVRLAHGAYQAFPPSPPANDMKGTQPMTTPLPASSPSGSRMKHDITIAGKTHKALPLKRAMLEVVRAAIAAGIHPNALKLHDGTSNAGTRWLHGATIAAATKDVTDESRWYIAHAFTVGNEIWILSSQWSWDEVYGSSSDDLKRIQQSFPQLGLTWSRY